MTEPTSSAVREEASGNRRLAILLAMAMFVLVVDTSLMNVSIAAVVRDLDTTVSGVQSAIALEALVSAAFILIGSKVGDLFGRKRAYVLGLLGYAVGALAMTLAQGLTAIIVFWALVGGIGASLLLPSMQSLIHGNFEGTAQRSCCPASGSSATRPTPGRGPWTCRRGPLRAGHGRRRARHPGLAGRRRVGRRAPGDRGVGPDRAGLLAWPAQRQGKPTLLDPELFQSKIFRLGISQQLLQQIALGGTMIVLPIYLQMVLEYNALQAGLSIAPLSLSMFGMALLAGRRAGKGKRRPSSVIRLGFALLTVGLLSLIPIVPRADSGWYLLVSLVIAGSGLGLLVSQLNNYTLAPISEERVSEAAGVNSAGGSFGLSFGLAFAGAIMLATLSIAFTNLAQGSSVLDPAEKQRVASALEHDAQVISNTQLQQLLAGQPQQIQDEIVRINTDARPLALQVALLVPILAALAGLLNSFRMLRLPEPKPSGAVEGIALG
jgi:MFS family permease